MNMGNNNLTTMQCDRTYLSSSMSSKPAYKKRRITPKAGYGTISAGAMASTFNKKVVALQRQVSQMQRSKERKVFDTSMGFNFDATGEIPATGQLALIPQGAADGQRIGRKCVVRSIQIRASVGFVPAASATASSTAHFFVILDKQANQAAAAVLDVFTATNLAIALRDPANWQRFTVLHHWYHTFTSSAGATTAYNNEQCALQWYKKVNIPLEFTGATGAITEITSNNIFCMASTDSASDDLIQFAGTARLTFTED